MTKPLYNWRDVLDADGAIAARLSRFELRPEQLEMAGAVDRAIRSGSHLAVEAGTGVGKSFAYLVPAIFHVVENQLPPEVRANVPVSGNKTPSDPSAQKANDDRYTDGYPFDMPSDDELFEDATPELNRVVISTHTISLQEQLYEKDIPFLHSILPYEFSSVLVKGRSNYLCLRRLERASQKFRSLFEDEHRRTFETICAWSKKTIDGSISDLPTTPPREIWSEICGEVGNCLGGKCKYRQDCFYAKARNRVANAQLLVVNHALLFSDLALRRSGGSILPQFKTLVFDEAHTMEQVAGDHLGVSITRAQVDYFLKRLYNDRANKGLLVEPGSDNRDAIEQVLECALRADELFESLYLYRNRFPDGNGRVSSPKIVPNGLSESLLALAQVLRKARDTRGRSVEERLEYSYVAIKIETLARTLEFWFDQTDKDYVYWLETTWSRGLPKVSMEAAPINVGPILREYLFSKVPTVIMTSATLSTRGVNGSSTGSSPDRVAKAAVKADENATREAFKFFRTRIGLTEIESLQLGSPFDYRRQAQVVLVENIPDRFTAGEQTPAFGQGPSGYALFLAALKRYIEETAGGAFVLFTNYTLLKSSAKDMIPWLAGHNMPFFSQGDGMPRSKMVELFKSRDNAVLFGTDSFWQGVDIPGHALRNVIITKLPFLVPGQPLIEARLEEISAQGGNPFRDYQLPHAILKLKQGFGRLIRTRDDTGMVVILDSRIRTKQYGRQFLAALPECKIRVDTIRQEW